MLKNYVSAFRTTIDCNAKMSEVVQDYNHQKHLYKLTNMNILNKAMTQITPIDDFSMEPNHKNGLLKSTKQGITPLALPKR